MNNSWLNTKIRKGNKIGKVIKDANGVLRILTVAFVDRSQLGCFHYTEEIQMNNAGEDSKSVHDFEWYDSRSSKWHKF